MSQDIVPVLDLGGQSLSRLPDAIAQDVLKTGDYLPYISIMGSNTDAVKEGKCPMGVWALVQNQTPLDLGKEIVMVVIAERAKAMKFGEQILTYFDPTSPEFKNIQAMAGVPNSKCMAGLEFLVWLPAVGENGTLAGLFCGSKSMKKEAASIRAFVGGKAMVGKIFLAKNASYSWHTGQVAPYTSPIANRPDPEKLKTELDKFINPKSSEVESANQPAGGRAR